MCTSRRLCRTCGAGSGGCRVPKRGSTRWTAEHRSFLKMTKLPLLDPNETVRFRPKLRGFRPRRIGCSAAVWMRVAPAPNKPDVEEHSVIVLDAAPGALPRTRNGQLES